MSTRTIRAFVLAAPQEASVQEAPAPAVSAALGR